jgi:hypothetical protein
MSQAVSYGDDASAATNYPLVRLRSPSTAKVWYCRTFGHSAMGVGSAAPVSSTNFVVPASLGDGPAILEIVANGIASPPQTTVVGPAPANGGRTARGCGIGALIVMVLAAGVAMAQMMLLFQLCIFPHSPALPVP